MTLSITHQYVSAVPDDGDATKVQPTDWNDTHAVTGLGTGVETALGVNVGSAGAVVVNGGALGTPSSGTLTNATGLPSIVVANEATDTTCFLAFFTAATGELAPKTNVNLAFNSNTGVLSLTNAALTTPTLGVASATSINKVAITAPASSATLTIADGKTLTVSNTLTFTGTDSSSVAFGAGGTVLYSGGSLTATAITVANEASDTTCFPTFTTAATGDLGPKSNAGLTFNSSTGQLGAVSYLSTQGTITAAATNIEGTVTWNQSGTTFTAWRLNVTSTASAGDSRLLDLQVGGTSVVSIGKSLNDTGNPILCFGGDTTVGWLRNSTAQWTFMQGSGVAQVSLVGGTLRMNQNCELRWTAGVSTDSHDTGFMRDGTAGITALRNGTTAHGLRWYGNQVSSTDYHRGALLVAKTTLSNVSGASVTATSLIPDGALVVGVTTKVTVAISGGGGTTGYQVGDGSDTDRWGVASTITAGTTTDNTNATATTVQLFTSANNVVLTADGGNFNGTGDVMVCVFYLIAQAD